MEYFGFPELLIKDEKKLEALEKTQVLMSFERDGQKQWILGPAGIQLVNSWKANELNKKIGKLNEASSCIRIYTLYEKNNDLFVRICLFVWDKEYNLFVIV